VETTVLSINISICEKTVKTKNNRNVLTTKKQNYLTYHNRKKFNCYSLGARKRNFLDGQVENIITDHNVQYDEILNRI